MGGEDWGKEERENRWRPSASRLYKGCGKIEFQIGEHFLPGAITRLAGNNIPSRVSSPSMSLKVDMDMNLSRSLLSLVVVDALMSERDLSVTSRARRCPKEQSSSDFPQRRSFGVLLGSLFSTTTIEKK